MKTGLSYTQRIAKITHAIPISA